MQIYKRLNSRFLYTRPHSEVKRRLDGLLLSLSDARGAVKCRDPAFTNPTSTACDAIAGVLLNTTQIASFDRPAVFQSPERFTFINAT